MNVYEDQRDYWDSVAEKKSFTTPFQVDLFSQYVDIESSILDIGCGYGRTLHELNQRDYKLLYGIDFSSQMIEKGKELYPSLNISVHDGKELPFSAKSFDSVILFAVLTCIIENDDQINLLHEIKRVLKPEGILYINDFLLNTDKRNIDRYNLYKTKSNNYGVFELPEGAQLRHHDPEWIDILLEQTGFGEIIMEKTRYTTMNGNRSNGFYYLGRCL